MSPWFNRQIPTPNPLLPWSNALIMQSLEKHWKQPYVGLSCDLLRDRIRAYEEKSSSTRPLGSWHPSQISLQGSSPDTVKWHREVSGCNGVREYLRHDHPCHPGSKLRFPAIRWTRTACDHLNCLTILWCVMRELLISGFMLLPSASFKQHFNNVSPGSHLVRLNQHGK